MADRIIPVTLYSRQDCHLCEQVRIELDSLQEEYPHNLTIVDIDGEAALQAKYGTYIPVIEVGLLTLKAPIMRQELAQALAFSIEREREDKPEIKPIASPSIPAKETWSKSDSFSFWLSRHYMLVFNLVFGLYVFLPLLAPILMKNGAIGPAKLIYRVYGAVCHQLAYRSLFLYGEQLVYPRAAAGVDEMLTFSQASGLGEGNEAVDVIAARGFIGTELMGYKVALCERDVAIYGSILLFGLVFALTKRKLKPLPWYLWIIIGLAPVALDGLSQLLSQPPLMILPYRESTPLLRIITGMLFGITTAWFGYPVVEQTMADTREAMKNKKERVERNSRLASV